MPDGKWEVYVKNDKAGTEVLEVIEGTVEISAISTLIAVKIPENPLDNLDLSGLRAIYDELSNLDTDLYTEESVEVVRQLVEESQAILSSENPTQEEIDAFVSDYVAVYGPDYGIDSVEAFYENNSVEDVKTSIRLIQNQYEIEARNIIIDAD